MSSLPSSGLSRIAVCSISPLPSDRRARSKFRSVPGGGGTCDGQEAVLRAREARCGGGFCCLARSARRAATCSCRSTRWSSASWIMSRSPATSAATPPSGVWAFAFDLRGRGRAGRSDGLPSSAGEATESTVPAEFSGAHARLRPVGRSQNVTGQEEVGERALTPAAPPRVSVLIVTYANGDEIERCLDGVLRQDDGRQSLEIIVVDNASAD